MHARRDNFDARRLIRKIYQTRRGGGARLEERRGGDFPQIAEIAFDAPNCGRVQCAAKTRQRIIAIAAGDHQLRQHGS